MNGVGSSHGVPPDGSTTPRGDIGGGERKGAGGRTRIKICGITRIEDAAAAAAAGVDAVGFVFISSSPRAVTYAAAGRIVETLPPFVTPVGVFLRPTASDIQEAVRVAGIALAQVLDARGIEQKMVPVPLLHAVRVGPGFDHSTLREWGMPEYLLDTHVEGLTGGTGQTFDWSVAAEAARYARIVLAGGLTPGNVGRAIEVARPFGVDVSSGVEAAAGIKSQKKIEAFAEAVRAMDR